MSDDESAKYSLRAILEGKNILRLGAIGIGMCCVVSAFAYGGGWLSPGALTQDAMINTFQLVNGIHPGFRRNHAKGLCISGYFDSNGNAQSISKAAVFQPRRVPVEGRFAVAVGAPDVPDSGKQVRSMALRFQPQGAEEWRTGMNDIPVFAVRSATAFRDQLLAMRIDPKTGKPDPAKVSSFLAKYPETAKAVALINSQPFSSGFANATYNSLNAFDFIASDGVVQPVRWAMTALYPFAPEQPGTPADPNYLFDEVVRQIGQHPLQWRLDITLGRPGDVTDDATIAWPADRKKIAAGLLTITSAEPEEQGNCRDINFDPLVLPDGIEGSDDPLLSARSAAYATSFTRRAGEEHTPSAVQIPEDGRGR